MWFPFILLLIAFEAIADIFSKKYALTGTVWNWILAVGGYLVANIFWLIAIRRGSGLARGAVLFAVGSAVVAVVIGLLLYKEPVSRLQMLGIIISLIGVAIISLSQV